MNGYNFTERVRKVLALARQEAAALEHEYVGTEHFLLGLLAEGEGVASAVLENLGADADGLRAAVFGLLKRGHRPASHGPDLPYTSRAKKVLELAMGEARELQHAYVGTEHLLLGLLREAHGIAAQVLAEAGVTRDGARAEVARLLGTAAGSRPPAPAAGGDHPRASAQPPSASAEQLAWTRLLGALDVCQRLGAPPTLTLAEDGTLTVPVGPDLVISVAFPPDLRLRRADPAAGAPASPPQERA